jgi:hypothetical protein
VNLHRSLADPLMSIAKTWRRLRKLLGRSADGDG